MKVELKDILTLIESKTSWGRNDLKEAILNMLAEKESV